MMAGARKRMLAHLDDVGVSAGSVTAWKALRAAGVVRSASLMVPCPWYRAAVDDFSEEPGQDIGIHLTLTSEWAQYRWRPLTGPVTRLTDDEGYFHKRPEAVLAHADPAAVEDEMAAQIERALADGIRPTHLDAHMGAAFLPPFIERLWSLASRYALPLPLCRDPSPLFQIVRLTGHDHGYLRELVVEAEHRGDPIFDTFLVGFTPEGTEAETFFSSLIGNAGEGLHWLALHANAPGDVGAFAPHMVWPREQEFRLFSDPASRALFGETEPVNWADLAVDRRGEIQCA